MYENKLKSLAVIALYAFMLCYATSSALSCSPAVDSSFVLNGTTVRTFPDGLFGSNCYVVHNDGEAVIIDAGVDPSPVAEYIFSKKLYVKAIILTHTHVDHAVMAPNMAELFEAPIVVHALDTNHLHYYTKEVINDLLNNGGLPESYLPQLKKYVNMKFDIIISNDTDIRVGREHVKIKHTPGHSAGSECVLVGDSMLFSGDIFVFESLGNAGFDTGDENEFKRTLENFILKNSDAINVFQGHGKRIVLSDMKALISQRISKSE